MKTICPRCDSVTVDLDMLKMELKTKKQKHQLHKQKANKSFTSTNTPKNFL